MSHVSDTLTHTNDDKENYFIFYLGADCDTSRYLFTDELFEFMEDEKKKDYHDILEEEAREREEEESRLQEERDAVESENVETKDDEEKFDK